MLSCNGIHGGWGWVGERERQTERERESETEREIGAERDREIDRERQKDRERERQREREKDRERRTDGVPAAAGLSYKCSSVKPMLAPVFNAWCRVEGLGYRV